MTDGQALALAKAGCSHCLGLGLRFGHAGRRPVCGCVWRHVFRLCLARFRRCVDSGGWLRDGHLCPTHFSGAINKPIRRMRYEDFCADFLLLSRRALAGRDLGIKLFRFAVLLGAEQPLVCRKLGIDRGTFYHELYRVQELLGRAFAQTLPYGLYPLDEYFGGTVRAAKTLSAREACLSSVAAGKPGEVVGGLPGHPLRAPLRPVAVPPNNL